MQNLIQNLHLKYVFVLVQCALSDLPQMETFLVRFSFESVCKYKWLITLPQDVTKENKLAEMGVVFLLFFRLNNNFPFPSCFPFITYFVTQCMKLGPLVIQL